MCKEHAYHVARIVRVSRRLFLPIISIATQLDLWSHSQLICTPYLVRIAKHIAQAQLNSLYSGIVVLLFAERLKCSQRNGYAKGIQVLKVYEQI